MLAMWRASSAWVRSSTSSSARSSPKSPSSSSFVSALACGASRTVFSIFLRVSCTILVSI